jgi:hypothetical protein
MSNKTLSFLSNLVKTKINGEKRDIETVVVSIIGDIDLRQISKMTSQMNIPGGEQLEKAGKGKK